MFENAIAFTLCTLVSSRILLQKFAFTRRVTRWPVAFMSSALLAFITNKVVLKPLLLQELDDAELTEKYSKLNMDEQMMRDDLISYGICEKTSLEKLKDESEKKL